MNVLDEIDYQVTMAAWDRRIAAEAQAEADAQAAAEAAAAHEQAFRAALPAALRALGLRRHEMTMAVHHIVRLATAAPVITIHWVARDSLTRTAMVEQAHAKGLAYLRHDEILTPCIEHYVNDPLIAYHEIGHIRDRVRGSAFQMEINAWRFAMEHSLQWDQRHHAYMFQCLKTSMQRMKPDSREVVEADALISQETLLQHWRAITPAQVATFEADVFELEHGARRCQGFCQPAARASVLWHKRALCGPCRDRMETDWQLADLKAKRASERAAAPRRRDAVAACPAIETRPSVALRKHGPNAAVVRGLEAMQRGPVRCGGRQGRCGALATRVRGEDGAPRCDTCRENERLDRTLSDLKRDRDADGGRRGR